MFPIEYLAGFFDGEGCVTAQKTYRKDGRVRFYLAISCSQNSKGLPVLEAFKTQWGGYIVEGGHKRTNQCLKWYVSFGGALTFLRAIRPHLFIKQRQATLAIELQEGVDTINRKRLTDAEFYRRERLVLEIHRLNQNKTTLV